MAKNVASLFATQFGSYVVPLATVPYLTRVLMPEAFGLVAFMQAVAAYTALIIDFGFSYSGTRSIARAREQPCLVKGLVSDITTAKLLLVITTLVIFAVLQHIVPTMRKHPTALWLGVCIGVAQGLNMYWFFQGMERLALVSLADITCKVAGAAAVFLFVHRPADALRVLGAQAVFYSLSVAWMHYRVFRESGFSKINLRSSLASLRESYPLFILRSAGGLFSSANALVLGLYAAPSIVGFYAGPDKIVKAVYGLQNPIAASIYPRLAYLAHHDEKQARRLATVSAYVQIGMMLPLCTLLYFLAPWLVRMFMGPGYGQSVPVLRILCFMLIPGVTAAVLGLQWMVSQGLEKVLNRITIAAGILNISLAYALVGKYQGRGMAFSVVAAETFVMLGIIGYLGYRRLKAIEGSHA